MFAGAVAGAAYGCVLATMEHGLEWQRGRIDRDEMLRRIARETGKSAGAGAAASGLMVAVALAFPSIIPLAAHLAIPLAVMGFCATGHKVVRAGVGWYEVLREPCARQVPSTFNQVLALPAPRSDQESIAGQLARLRVRGPSSRPLPSDDMLPCSPTPQRRAVVTLTREVIQSPNVVYNLLYLLTIKLSIGD